MIQPAPRNALHNPVRPNNVPRKQIEYERRGVNQENQESLAVEKSLFHWLSGKCIVLSTEPDILTFPNPPQWPSNERGSNASQHGYSAKMDGPNGANHP